MKVFKIILIILVISIIGFGVLILMNPNMFNESVRNQEKGPEVFKQTIIKANGIKEDEINGEKVNVEREYYFVINEEYKVTACLVRDYNLTEEQLDFEYNRFKRSFEPIFLKDLSKEDGILSYSSIMFLSCNYDELIKSLEEQNFTYKKL